jgi:hypothetical protein
MRHAHRELMNVLGPSPLRHRLSVNAFAVARA